MRILITGAAGFIGRHLTPELEAFGHEVITTDRAGGDYDYPGVDLLREGDAYRLCGSTTPDVVVHLAAQVGRLFGEDDLAHSIESNATLTARVAKAAESVGARLVYVSSSEVYGDAGETECREAHVVGWAHVPHNIYGLSKLWGEHAARLYAKNLQIVRLSMPYGPGVPPGRGRAALVNICHQAVTGQEMPIHEGSERAWCWIGDTVRGIRTVIEDGDTTVDGSPRGVYNIGRDDNALPMVELARVVCAMVGADPALIKIVPAPAHQTIVKRLSTKRLRRLGWEPLVPIDDGLLEVLEWVRHFDANGLRIQQGATVD